MADQRLGFDLLLAAVRVRDKRPSLHTWESDGSGL